MNFNTSKNNKIVPKNIKEKRATIFNKFCFLWYGAATFLILGRAYKYKIFIDLDIAMHLLFCSVIAILQVIHYKGYRQTAYILFNLCLIIAIYAFCNFMMPGKMREFYFLLCPPITLVFIDKKILKYLLVVIAFLCFTIPNLIYHYYDFWSFNDPTQSLLFFSIYFIVNYFKKINFKNELALEQKTEELKNINDFQSQFFINISHEIRTPLTLIKGYLTDLKELKNIKSQAIEKKLEDQTNKINYLVNDVIDLAKIESSKFKINTSPIKISTIIREVFINFESLFAQKKINFKLKCNSNSVILADQKYLERALENILTNALKYTNTNGFVDICVNTENTNIIISINDTGIGISEKDTQKIFKRFYQASNTINKTGGSGVGLAFTKEIIKLHKGAISVKSKKNKGSSFLITLPVTHQKIDTNLNASIVTNNDETYNKTSLIKSDCSILIVDDTTEMRLYLKRILKKYKCIEAENGVEALEILKKQPVDFIITDYMMPHMNGYEFIKKLKQKKDTTPILMLTARGDTKSKLDVLKLGIDDYIQKPFDQKELYLRIENGIKNYQNRKQYLENNNVSTTEIEENISYISKIKKFIDHNCNKTDFNQANICDNFHLSQSSLYRKIKSETGLSPNNLINEIKLQKARKIIDNNPNMSLKQLSLEMGFSNSFYFSKLFTTRFGYKPTNKSSK